MADSFLDSHLNGTVHAAGAAAKIAAECKVRKYTQNVKQIFDVMFRSLSRH